MHVDRRFFIVFSISLVWAAVVAGAIAGGMCALIELRSGARAIPYAPAIAVGVWISLAGGS